ncbi:MAG: SusC/RagA family TonB-linked outer membrane protein [Gemmatimonadaceae bacterium]
MRWYNRLNLFLLVLAFPLALSAQDVGVIAGAVSDSGSQQPLADVRITVVGTALRAVTTTDGRYTIGNVPTGTQQVRVQRIGYAPVVHQVVVRAGETAASDFVIRPQATVLGEVVSVGYGTQKQRDIAGSVSVVTTEALERAPVTSVDQVLQGTSPGVQVTTASSEPGGALSIRIRGTASITGSSEPLYVIDGFPIENDIEGSSVGNGGRTRTTPPNPLVTLNPSDIASISILKDASATAIYGARGANGVVIITTKQGEGSKPKFGLDYYSGTQTLAKKYDLLNAAEYMDYANTYGQNSGTAFTPFPDSVKAAILASGVNTDWQNAIFQSGKVDNLQLSVRGATTTASPTRYAVSGGFFNQGGIVMNSGLSRFSGRVNLDQQLGDRFEFGANLSASRARSRSVPTAGQQNANAGAVSAALQYVPILPIYRQDGTYSYINTDLNAYNSLLDAPQTPNPVSLAREVRDSLTDMRLLSNAFGQVTIIPGLQFRSSIGTDLADRSRFTFYPRTTLRGATAPNGEALRATSSTTSWLNENTLTYQRTLLGIHDINLVAGFTRQETSLNGESLSASNFASDITGYNDIGSGTQIGVPSSRNTKKTLESVLARINYSLLDRYLATVTYRDDGSSVFAASHKWAPFPSAALAWRASSEPWFHDLPGLSQVNELKFRGSYGVVGNPGIRPYQSLATLNDQPYSFGGQQYSGYYITAIGNPQLKWETTREADGGIDLGLFDRFTVIADYYKKTTTDLLLQIQLPFETGFETALANRGSVSNAGVELGIDARIMSAAKKGGFDWHANLNFAKNRNKVLNLGGENRIFADLLTTDYNLPGTLIQVGQPLGVFYGFKSLGVIRDTAAANKITYTNFNNGKFQEGDMLIADISGPNGVPDGKITLDDRTIIGDPTPKFTAGLTNTFSWNGFELTGLLQGAFGNKILNINRIRTESSPRVNISRERYYNSWSPTHRDAKYPAIGENPNQVGPNNITSNLLEDGTYVRLRTITLSYGIPAFLLSKYNVDGARVYVTGTNLFTSTDYTGYDPDVSSQSVGNVNRGIDIGAYPLAKGVTFGINFSY